MIQAIIFLVLLVIGILIAVRGGFKATTTIKATDGYSNDKTEFSGRQFAPYLILGILFLFIAIASTSAIKTIGAGERGVVLRFGAVTGKILPEGLSIITPFVESVAKMDVKTEAYEAEASAASNDLQDVRTSVTVNYRLDPGEVDTVYQRLRRDYERRILAPAVQESVKAVTATFSAEQLITERPSVKSDIEEAINDRLFTNGIILETLSITNFTFSASFTNAIESKVEALQSALKAENDLVRIQTEAQQREAVASGEANAIRQEAQAAKEAAILTAEGESQALLLVAGAKAEANNLIAASINDEIIQWETISKLADDINTIILPAGQEFILGETVIR